MIKNWKKIEKVAFWSYSEKQRRVMIFFSTLKVRKLMLKCNMMMKDKEKKIFSVKYELHI